MILAAQMILFPSKKLAERTVVLQMLGADHVSTMTGRAFVESNENYHGFTFILWVNDGAKVA